MFLVFFLDKGRLYFSHFIVLDLLHLLWGLLQLWASLWVIALYLASLELVDLIRRFSCVRSLSIFKLGRLLFSRKLSWFLSLLRFRLDLSSLTCSSLQRFILLSFASTLFTYWRKSWIQWRSSLNVLLSTIFILIMSSLRLQVWSGMWNLALVLRVLNYLWIS